MFSRFARYRARSARSMSCAEGFSSLPHMTMPTEQEQRVPRALRKMQEKQVQQMPRVLRKMRERSRRMR